MTKKIGILTLSASDNCGSLLQAYALQEFLKIRYDCKVEIINFISQASHQVYDMFPKGFWRHPKKTFFTIKHYKSIAEQKKGYDIFRQKYLNMTPQVYSSINNLKEIIAYDIIIVGSDQIWNVKMMDYDDAFFIPWRTPAKKIAYAASLGKTVIFPNNKVQFVKKCLSDFKGISIREKEGLTQLKEVTDINVCLAADPTLLLEKDTWNKIIGNPLVEDEYIFFYSWSYPDIEMNKIVQKYSKKKGIPAYVINSSKWYRYRPEQFDFILYRESGPITFLNLMKYAKYVFVQSFHGAVFANIFQKNFYFLNEQKYGYLDFRSSNLLENLHQMNRVIHEWSDLQKAESMEIKYESIEMLNLLKQSIDFLDMAVLGE